MSRVSKSSYVGLISDPHHFFYHGQHEGMQGLRGCPPVSEGVSGHPPRFQVEPVAAGLPQLLRDTAGLGHPLGQRGCTSRVSVPPPGAWGSRGTCSPSALYTGRAAGPSPGSARVGVRWLAQ